MRQLWASGSQPVPATADSRVLFTQEESPAGLYVLENGSATLLNPSGPEARTDYTWSSDGQRIAFSSPGPAGSAGAGIWLSDAGDISAFHRIWDRGSHPRLYPTVEELLVCAGPEDRSGDEGIWEMTYAGVRTNRIADFGADPEVSPDGARIAYLVTAGNSTGRTLMTYNRATHERQAVADSVLRHAWLSDSQTLVYETLRNGFQEIRLRSPNADVSVGGGTAPSAMLTGTGFLFTGIEGDRSAGIYRGAVGVPVTQIADLGANARHAGGNRVVAQDSSGLIEILF